MQAGYLKTQQTAFKGGASTLSASEEVCLLITDAHFKVKQKFVLKWSHVILFMAIKSLSYLFGWCNML